MDANLRDIVLESVAGIIKKDGLSRRNVRIYLERPKEKKFGDWSINVAMKIAKDCAKPPLETAKFIAGRLENILKEKNLSAKIEKIEVRPPGFVNIFLSREALCDVLETIAKEGGEFGRSELGNREKVLIEFVSANPTGPLSIAHARQAAVGDTLAKIMKFSGFEADKEYYINDEGNQIRMLGLSLKARVQELRGEKIVQFPEDGYKGEYLKDLAAKLIKEKGDVLPAQGTEQFFMDYAAQSILEIIKEELKAFGVAFDSWFSQKELSKSGKIGSTLEKLEKDDFLYKEEGATWFKSTALGDDKDRVLIKSDGQFTYLTPDIAYHKLKFERGYQRLVNIWGPDHHGYINRLKAAVAALGYKPENLQIIIIQLATLFRDNKPVVMSTRAGEYITLTELMREVGKDAARFFFMMRRCDSHLDFDLELAKKESLENPIYYIQYAHARICSILQFKESKGTNKNNKKADFVLLKEEEELDLIRELVRFPDVIEDCAVNLEPQGLTVYLRELAGQFHSFYNKVQVVSEKEELSEARIALVACVRQVIRTGLNLLGIAPMEKM